MQVKSIQLLALVLASQQASAEANADSFVENLNKLSELSSTTNDMVNKFSSDTVVNDAPVRLPFTHCPMQSYSTKLTF